VLSVPLGVMRLSENRVLRWLSLAYVWFFRGTPVLVQLLFWYNFALLYPQLSLSLPFGGPTIFSVATNDVMTSLVAALVGLGLNLAAYMAEVVRGGSLGVDKGQTLCARSLGMSSAQIMGRIVLPQAMRTIIPAAGNYTISMLKYTSLASVVALNELLLTVQTIYSRNFLVIPLLAVASIWYLALTSILSVGQHFLERYFGRGYGEARRRRVQV
jgi:polar amino acid transport system permease protein